MVMLCFMVSGMRMGVLETPYMKRLQARVLAGARIRTRMCEGGKRPWRQRSRTWRTIGAPIGSSPVTHRHL